MPTVLADPALLKALLLLSRATRQIRAPLVSRITVQAPVPAALLKRRFTGLQVLVLEASSPVQVTLPMLSALRSVRACRTACRVALCAPGS